MPLTGINGKSGVMCAKHSEELGSMRNKIPELSSTITREQAWSVVLEHENLVKDTTNKFADMLTGYGARSFAGHGKADTFEDLIGEAYEAALVAVETHKPGTAKLTTYMVSLMKKRMQSAAEKLNAERGGPEVVSYDNRDWPTAGIERLEEANARHQLGVRGDSEYRATQLPSVSDITEAHFSDEDREARVLREQSTREYVERLLMTDLTEQERRLAHVIMKGEDRIPYFSSTWRSLRDKLVRRAAYLEAEGYGSPIGWERAISRRISEQARGWADGV